MQVASKDRPIIAIVMGDPAGIGPEIVARALSTGRVHECSRPVLIGSAAAMERAIDMTGVSAIIRKISSLEELSGHAGAIEIIDDGALDPENLPLGEDTASAGEAVGRWLDQAHAFARSGAVAALVLAPISSGSFKLAGKRPQTVSPIPGESYLVLFSGPLRVAHLTDHLPLTSVAGLLTPDLLLDALRRLDTAMKSWGLQRRRIGVAGFNPHASGEEEQRAIVPGVGLARAEGIDAEGPVSPDAVFRQCIEGRYDLVLAMYHDQGHIAIKTWGFSGNCVMVLGPPYLFFSVAHGTAYDIVGKGIADPSMMLSAMCTAAQLAAGKGFPSN